MVRVGEIIEDGVVDGEATDTKTADCQDGRNPVNIGPARPPEPEQAHGQEDGLDADDVEPTFRRLEALRETFRRIIVDQNGHNHRYYGANAHC